MAAMSPSEIDAFLHELHHAIVGTLRRDGSIQLSSVWYLYDDGVIYISVSTGTAKYHNLRRDPRLSVCVDAGHPDARSVVFHGVAEILEPGQRNQQEIRRRIIRRYKESDEEAKKYEEETRGVEAALIVLKPEKILSWNFN